MKNISTFKKAFYYIQFVWITHKSDFNSSNNIFLIIRFRSIFNPVFNCCDAVYIVDDSLQMWTIFRYIKAKNKTKKFVNTHKVNIRPS